MDWQLVKSKLTGTTSWREFVTLFVGVLAGAVAGIYVFILLIDPYNVVPFSLPIDRHIVSIADRFMYPQIVRSKRFDSLIIGTSTARLLDPEILDKEFHARFANLAFYSGMAWEQKTMLDYFVRKVGPPKVLIVGLDFPWCDQKADIHRITFRGFPDWLYDDNPWNDYLYLFNYGTLETSARVIGYRLGLYPERIRYDGYDVFVPPEQEYDPVRAHNDIWRDALQPADLLPPLSPNDRAGLKFPALAWLNQSLARLPPSTLKILAFMPVNVAAQPVPNSEAASVEYECKARIAAMGNTYGAKVIDWRIASPLTSNDANYWDSLHYRVPIATRIAKDLAAAALNGRASKDGSYRILGP